MGCAVQLIAQGWHALGMAFDHLCETQIGSFWPKWGVTEGGLRGGSIRAPRTGCGLGCHYHTGRVTLDCSEPF